jgi:hypothetical protein
VKRFLYRVSDHPDKLSRFYPATEMMMLRVMTLKEMCQRMTPTLRLTSCGLRSQPCLGQAMWRNMESSENGANMILYQVSGHFTYVSIYR